jgi:hypothetical protein
VATTDVEMINGFPIIREHRLAEAKGQLPARLILVDRGEEHAPERYVTAVVCDGRRSWLHGHYFVTWAAALADFDKRSKRGY